MFCLKDLLFSISLAALLSFFASNTFAGDAPLVLSADGKVNIKQVLQMTPQSIPPSDPVDGDIYYSTNNELLLYSNGAWNLVLFHTHNWVAGSWGACSASCGGGVQTRSVVCKRSDGTTVPEIYCSGTKPTNSQPCNPQACYYWDIWEWTRCSSYCGGGTMSRVVYCRKTTNNQIVSSSLCPAPQPATSAICNTHQCH